MGNIISKSFKIFWKNKKVFLLLIAMAMLVGLLEIGVNEETAIVLNVIIFLTLWLVTIYLMRHILKGEKVKLRDGLYNAMAPLLSSLVIFVVLAAQCIPIIVLVVTFAAALETGLFADFFAGSLYVLFAIVMVAISVYLVSGTMMALIAVSAPGMYPVRALMLTREVMRGERVNFMVRLVVLALVLGAMVGVVVGVGVLIELGIRQLGAVSGIATGVAIFTSGCFATVFAAIYLYLYYRKVLKMEDKK